MTGDTKKHALKQAVKNLKTTIPRMKDLEIPMTPENYFIWYEFENGKNKELTKTLQEYIDNSTTFTPTLNNELFEKFFADRNRETLSDVQGGTEKLVEGLLSELEGMQTGAASFSNALGQSQQELKKNPDLKSITKLVANLLAETEQVTKINSTMEQKLSVMKDEVSILKQNMDDLNTTAYTDKLTKLPNRRAFDEAIERMFEEFEANNDHFSLLFMDIDHFKKFNDTHGHAVGDKVLTFIATILKLGIKGGDMVARYGGEEFIVLLPQTNYQGAVIVAQQLCNSVAKKTLIMGGESKTSLGNIHISVGVSVISAEDNIESLVQRADKALYL